MTGGGVSRPAFVQVCDDDAMRSMVTALVDPEDLP